MKLNPKAMFQLFKNAAADWSNDHAPQLGASLAFYTIFSLAPLMTIVISIAALWFSQNASHEIFNQLGSVIGTDNAASLQKMLVQPGKQGSGIFATISAGVMLVFGATGVFVQLQDALNQIWEVKQKSGQGIMGFVRHRLLSLAMVLGIAFLLLVSLILTAVIGAAGKYFGQYVGGMSILWQVVNTVVSFGLIAMLFALMYKYVPDAEISWKDVWFGGMVTALLFTIGKFALGLYLGKSSVASTYAAAASLIVLLLWVYYTAQILFFGAELTQEYAEMRGREVVPSPHAEWDEEKLCRTKAAEKKREKKEAVAQKKPAKEPALPQPVLAMAAAGAPAAGVSGTGGRSKIRFGGLLLLAFVLIPIERKLFGPK